MAKVGLVGDIGGTNSRFALVEPGMTDVRDMEALKNERFSSLEEAIQTYLGKRGITEIESAAIAVAAPVVREVVTLTNRKWSFTAESLRQTANARELKLLNDYEALALALPHLHPTELVQIGGQEPMPRGVKIVLGPGTGLGMAALMPVGPQSWIPIPCEPGHTSLPVDTQEEFNWREAMRHPGQTFTAEDAVTGGGLYRMYRVKAPHGKLTTPEEVIKAAIAENDPDAMATVDQFIVWLARIAGDAAMGFLAKGGVYLAGGIVPSITGLLARGHFRSVFEDKGKLAHVMKPVPVYVIIDPFPAFKGCAAAL